MLQLLPVVVAHRGFTENGAADNSLAAFAAAVAGGAEMVEFDVRACGDDLVVTHDASIDGIRLADHTYAELNALLGARTPPRFEECLAVLSGHTAIDCEIKDDGIAAAVVAALQRHFTTADCVVTSFQDWVISDVKALWPELQCGLLLPRASEFAVRNNRLGPVAAAMAIGADFIAVSAKVLTDELCDAAVAAQLPVLVWTVNNPVTLRRLMRDQRVVAICTDRPILARRVRAVLPATAPTRQSSAVDSASRGPLHF